ncbi:MULTISPECIES: NADP-dependent malic enzyme [Thalassospira]|jgi:malate dehydrogenase (oxaloacetate-decarboxylating)(NADP+)|uniref:NADP-dependent malic enzyme n=1 Tax=Thalassospira povalilytica TaxID=732237 RepID=A0A8I1MAR1_9PROT|nr:MULTISPECIES: NADP-dependent malic enzyme [Thalassospira]MEE3045605.1 NADP-dependent malic enzyme [Pseudomonadota bacterium]KZB69941.1 malic enzyme [Thalassospira sp. MCCC 1A02491]MBN8198179.1 NADP-dependent malic enzyme [Thalassospira povalilytica]MBO6771682.1 NADP-dependent malic enzyme [Thalassospira sp.]MCC4239143.1 NADP-dependent malic enzyme [Thalassospira povalilytica]
MANRNDKLREAALDYHRYPTPGKLSVTATTTLANQRDLALAYSPGVAFACEEIVKNPDTAAEFTARGNLVGVISNGTAVLGLGPIGPLASKPVMEGKAVLFKKFANIDVFDLEVAETDPQKFIDIVAALEPTFGGVNLEDIKAPECFIIEKALRERCNIPIFHDDQHGTAICVAAAVLNGLRVTGKDINKVRLVASGAGAAALACLNLLVSMGLPKENITVTDRFGVVYKGRQEEMDPWKAEYAIETNARTLSDVVEGADIFLGLSAPNVMGEDELRKMGERPIIMALANPTPEVSPELVKEIRPDAVMATGRTDYPNQVNNVLCFPFLFRGALDVGATEINEEMKIAAVEAIADLATAEVSDVVATAYGGEELKFGPEYLIPKPFDPRLMLEIPPRVAKAAMDSGVAKRPIEDFDHYRQQLEGFVFRSGLVMKPVFDMARAHKKRVVYPEGESRRVLQACQVLVDDGVCHPVVIGRREVILDRIAELGLRLVPDEQIEIHDPDDNPHFEQDWQDFHNIMGRRGINPEYARSIVRTRPTVIAALMLRRGEVDAMLCGCQGGFLRHLRYVRNLVGLRKGVTDFSTVNMMIMKQGTFFLTDTYVSVDPTPEHVAETTIMAADVVKRFGITPKAALISHSNFGSHENKSACKMRDALQLIRTQAPDLEVEGEMHADAAISQPIRDRIFPHSMLKGSANLLVMPTLDAANISYNLVKMLGDGLPVGPILVGAAKSAHVVSPSITVRGIVNMTAIAVVDAVTRSQEGQ